MIIDQEYDLMKDDLTYAWNAWTHKVPAHVDGRELFCMKEH